MSFFKKKGFMAKSQCKLCIVVGCNNGTNRIESSKRWTNIKISFVTSVFKSIYFLVCWAKTADCLSLSPMLVLGLTEQPSQYSFSIAGAYLINVSSLAIEVIDFNKCLCALAFFVKAKCFLSFVISISMWSFSRDIIDFPFMRLSAKSFLIYQYSFAKCTHQFAYVGKPYINLSANFGLKFDNLNNVRHVFVC